MLSENRVRLLLVDADAAEDENVTVQPALL